MNLLDRIKQDANALAILTDWLGKRGEVAPKELAQARADVCKACPFNQHGGRLEATVAATILEQETVRSKIGAEVDGENRLKTCQKCGCYLKLKVWVPMRHLRPRSRIADFPAHCWMQTENPKAEPVDRPVRRVVTVKRMAAHGDVLMASTIATKLWERGIATRFLTSKACAPTLAHHPHIDSVVTDESIKADVDLDKSYETNLEKNRKSIAALLIDASQHQLAALSIPPLTYDNLRPVINVTTQERNAALRQIRQLTGHQMRIVVFIRASASWPNRQLDPKDFHRAISHITDNRCAVFVAASNTEEIEGPNIHQMSWVRSFRDLMAVIAVADVVVTPDSGPLHVAAGLGKPTVVIETCNDTDYRVNGQTDVRVVRNGELDCAPCHEFTCPINASKPPCQRVNAKRIADAVADILQDRLTVVIPTYLNSSPHIGKCLDAIPDVAAGKRVEIRIARDGNCAFSTNRENVEIIPSTGKRLGYGKTCNRGVRGSSGEWILFLNDDCILDHGAIERMLEAGRQSDVAVVGCLLRYPDGTIQHGGQQRSGGIGYGHIDHRMRNPTLTKLAELESVTFAAALVRRSAFYAVGGFDERYDCYCEDTDLCMRVRRAGWRVMYTPLATGVHHESVSTKATKAKMAGDAQRIFAARWEPYFRNNPLGVLGTNWEGTR